MTDYANVVKYPFQIQWKIDERDLKIFGQKVGDSVKSKSFSTTTYGSNYHLRIYPYGYKLEKQQQTWISLEIDIGFPKVIKVAINISIDSANWSKDFQSEFTIYNQERYFFCCPYLEFFDYSKKFIVNGFLNLTIKGTFKVDERSRDGYKEVISFKKQKLSKMLWEDDDNKDFTISAEGQSIKVHKHVLAVYSPVFAGMFKSGMKEATENSVKIPNYPFEIVENIVELCYDLDVSGDDIFDNRINFFTFADQYMMTQIKEMLETFLIKRLSVLNVCTLANFSIDYNVPKLKECCYDLLMTCLKHGTAVNDLNYLDKDFKLKIFDNAFSTIA